MDFWYGKTITVLKQLTYPQTISTGIQSRFDDLIALHGLIVSTSKHMEFGVLSAPIVKFVIDNF